MVHSKERNKSLKINLKETQTLEILDKNFKTTVLKMLHKLKKPERPRSKGKSREQYMNKTKIPTKIEKL